MEMKEYKAIKDAAQTNSKPKAKSKAKSKTKSTSSTTPSVTPASTNQGITIGEEVWLTVIYAEKKYQVTVLTTTTIIKVLWKLIQTLYNEKVTISQLSCFVLTFHRDNRPFMVNRSVQECGLEDQPVVECRCKINQSMNHSMNNEQ